MASVLMPAFTVAEWGGLHENAVSAAGGLIRAGHEVHFVCRAGEIATAARSIGAVVYETDWSDPVGFAGKLLQSGLSPDLVFAQPQASRVLGLEVASRVGCPLYVMFHGHYADGAAYWGDEVRRFAGVSSSLVDLLTGYCGIDPWRVDLVPNGIDDSIVDAPCLPLAAKLEDGTGLIISAGRLESDKTAQRDVFEEIIPILGSRSTTRWDIVFLGDGDERAGMEQYVSRLTAPHPNISFRFSGWVSPDEVERLTRSAVFSVGAGRFAALSLAVGTPCVGVGKHGSVGLQFGSNLHIGEWSNFGDYPLLGAADAITSIMVDLPELLTLNYERVQSDGWSFVSRSRRQSAVDELLRGFLDL